LFYVGTVQILPSCSKKLLTHAIAFYTVGLPDAHTHFLLRQYQTSRIERTVVSIRNSRLCQLCLPGYLYDACGRSLSYGLRRCLATRTGYKSPRPNTGKVSRLVTLSLRVGFHRQSGYLHEMSNLQGRNVSYD
jgi:hypothetical protein